MTQPTPQQTSQPVDEPTPAAPREGAVINRFRIVSLHARGGLGEVYLAHDAELDRDVALKTIRVEHRDRPDSLRRFQLEAEVTARLEHPGVAPVYGLVRDSDSTPAYAMRLLRGTTLKQSLKEFHRSASDDRTPARPIAITRGSIRGLLQHFLSLCRTTAYAHQQAIIHRDIKPSNVIIGDFGETWLVDWGMAKLHTPRANVTTAVEADGSVDKSLTGPATVEFLPEGSGTDSTNPGQMIGTPGFMSPEQALGQWDLVGPSSDIFSLGATLYVVLTGKPPHGGTAEEARARALRGEVLSPRLANPTISPALDAICLKAMARDPGQRYATAGELADDLERWMADEPVTCYRDSWIKRLLRFGNRHRYAAVALGVSTLLLTAFSVLAAVFFAERESRERGLREAADSHSRVAEDQRARADAAYSKAKEAIDEYLLSVSESEELEERDLNDLRSRLLKSAIPFYDWLAANSASSTDSVEVVLARAATLAELGGVEQHVKMVKESVGHYRQSEALLRQLLKKDPHWADARRLLAATLGGIENGERILGNAAQACAAGDEAEAIQVKLAGEDLQTSDQVALLELLVRRIESFIESEQRTEVVRRAGQVIDWPRPAMLNDQQRRRWDAAVARASSQRGSILIRQGELEHALEDLRKSVDLETSLHAGRPLSRSTAHLASGLYNLGQAFANHGQHQQAVETLLKARDLLAALVRERPQVPSYEYTLAWIEHELGKGYRALQQPAEEDAAFARALTHGEQAARLSPEDPEHLRGLSWFVEASAFRAEREGDGDAEMAAFQQALDLRREYLTKRPDSLEGVMDLGWSVLRVADAYRHSGDQARAIGLYDEGIAIAERVLIAEPAHQGAQELLRWCGLNRWSRFRDAHDDALAMCDRALRLTTREAPLFHALRAMTLCRLNRLEEARQALASAQAAIGQDSYHNEYAARGFARLASCLPDVERPPLLAESLKHLAVVVAAPKHSNKTVFAESVFAVFAGNAEFERLATQFAKKQP